MITRVSRTVAPSQSSGCGSSFAVYRTTRRVVALAVVCGFVALALASTAGARVGCNAPNLVPINQEPPQWRNLAPAFCIHRTTQVIYSPYDIVAAHMKGFYWCLAWAQKPATPLGFIFHLFTASNFCKSRAWYYVRVIT
jgi:hypothetical protein